MNWGRFLPQIVFSISSYLHFLRLSPPSSPTLPLLNFVVPTGNFGNILGLVYAKKVLGVPIGSIVSASNQNNILYEFITTGTYSLKQKKFYQTVSPSIDILISSNLERFIHLFLSDTMSPSAASAEVARLFSLLQSEGEFSISVDLLRRIQKEVQAGWTTEQQCLDTIKQTYETTGQFIDPHTAVAVHVANELFGSTPDVPVIVSSTAHYAKFPNALCAAFGRSVPSSDEKNLPRMLEHMSQIDTAAYATSMHLHLAKLIDAPVLHNEHCKAESSVIVDKIKTFLTQFAKKQKQQRK